MKSVYIADLTLPRMGIGEGISKEVTGEKNRWLMATIDNCRPRKSMCDTDQTGKVWISKFEWMKSER